MGFWSWTVLVALFAIVLWELYAIRQALGAVAYSRAKATRDLEDRVRELERQLRP